MYPVPKQMGGTLIRRIVTQGKAEGLVLPLQGPVFIAVSGGADSIALAHMLATYGRRFCIKENLTVVHINHHWRGEASNRDARFVGKFAKKLGVSYLCFDLDPAHLAKGVSPEEAARKERQKIFKTLARENPGAKILTAHHADDLAETWLWRLFTGQIDTHGEGIRYQNQNAIRPLLSAHKNELIQYLNEEKLKYRFDRSNRDEKYLRARMRKRLTPVLDQIFSQWKMHVLKVASQAASSRRRAQGVPAAASLAKLAHANDLKLRRSHFNEFARRIETVEKSASMPLPNGFVLKLEKAPNSVRHSERLNLKKSQ